MTEERQLSSMKNMLNSLGEHKKSVTKYSIVILLIISSIILSNILMSGTLPSGEYTANVQALYQGEEVNQNISILVVDDDVTYPSTSLNETKIGNTSYILVFRYNKQVRAGFREKFQFYVRIKNEDNTTAPLPEISQVNLTIYGASIEKRIPPIRTIEDYQGVKWIEFTYRIPFKTEIVVAVLFIVGILWVSEVVPLVATSFLVPIIGILAVVDIRGESIILFEPFADSVIFLFLGGFIISKAMNKTELDKWIALNIVKTSPNNPRILMLIMMVVSAVLSMFMSNTATAATMIPIAMAVADKLKAGDIEERKAVDRYGKALVLGIAYSASLGGIGSAIGTPANPIAIKALYDYLGIEITFAQWFIFGLPIVIILLPISWIYLWYIYHPVVPIENMKYTKEAVNKELHNMGKLNGKQIYTLCVFVLALILWFSESLLRRVIPTFSSTIVALIAATLLFMPGMLEDRDVNDLNLASLLIFGGGLALGVLMTETGTSDIIAYSLANMHFKYIILFVFIVTIISVVITVVASNTGAAAIVIPLVIPLAVLFGISPVLLAVVAAIGASIDFMLPQGTPPTMIAYSTGKYKVSEMVKIGSLIVFLGIIILSFVLPFFWRALGYVTF